MHTVYLRNKNAGEPHAILAKDLLKLLRFANYRGWIAEKFPESEEAQARFEEYLPNCEVSDTDAGELAKFLEKVREDDTIRPEEKKPPYDQDIEALIRVSRNGAFTIRRH